MKMDPTPLTFRPLALADLALMHGWFAQAHVAEWYRDEAELSYEDIVAKYAPRIQSREPVRAFIIAYGNHPIGYIQVYMVRDYPDYKAYIDVDDGTAGVDLFIGDPAYIGRGLGGPMLTRFLRAIVFAADDATGSLIDPDVANTRAIHSYEKAGYRHVTTIEHGSNARPIHLMYVGKDDVMDRRDGRATGDAGR